MYLFVLEDGTIWQCTDIDSEDIENCLDGILTIIRFEDKKFKQLTPIDETDLDNWTEID